MIDLKNKTYGAEYEFGDIWLTDLPDGLTWNTKDYSIVSSTGIANDPKGLLYKRGGEINSQPTSGIEEQLSMFRELLEQHPEAAVNHRTNLHLHVRVPGLSQDLVSLKRLLSYIDSNQGEIYKQIEPIPYPAKEDFKDDESHKGALKRFRRRRVSHQYPVPKDRVKKALEAETIEGFLAAHAPQDKKGKPAWGLTTRAGINLLQLKETDTVEFRHFTCTKDTQELASCFVWVSKFIEGALDNAPVKELLRAYPYRFPKFAPYNHAMEVGYGYTNFDKLSRKVVAARLEAMRKDLNLEECSAEQVVEWIKESA